MLKEIHCIIKYFLRIFLFYKWNMHIPHTSLYVYAINITKTRQNTKYYKVLPKIYILQRVDYQSHFPVKKIACKWFQLSKLIYIYYFMLFSLCHTVELLFHPQFLKTWVKRKLVFRWLRQEKFDGPKVMKKNLDPGIKPGSLAL